MESTPRHVRVSDNLLDQSHLVRVWVHARTYLVNVRRLDSSERLACFVKQLVGEEGHEPLDEPKHCAHESTGHWRSDAH